MNDQGPHSPGRSAKRLAFSRRLRNWRKPLILAAALLVLLLAGALALGFINPTSISDFLHSSSFLRLLGLALLAGLAAMLLVDSRYRRPAWITFAVLGALFAIFFTIFYFLSPLVDVRAYYNAAARLNAGLPLYPTDVNANAAEFYRYPPLLAILWRPLALLPYQVAALIWEAFCLLLFGLTLRRLDLRRFEVRIALGVLAVFIARALVLGQAEMLVTWALTVGSPWSVALAANLKLFPMLVGLYWLGRRDWRQLRALMIAMVSLGLFQLILEPTNSIAFLGIANFSQAAGAVNDIPLYHLLGPILWLALAIAGVIAVVGLARTKAGWPAAVVFAVLVTPRLFAYSFTTFLAGLRQEPVKPKPSQPTLGPLPIQDQPAADKRNGQSISG